MPAVIVSKTFGIVNPKAQKSGAGYSPGRFHGINTMPPAQGQPFIRAMKNQALG